MKEAERKYVLESKDKAGAITPDEKNELAAINETDKDRDQAIKAVCTDGNKGGSGCGALVGPAEEALKKYGENITYSLLYKDLYPQDARNLESVLQGLDKGNIGRDQAIAAIAQASGVSLETAASRYDTAMQTQALTAALAGAVGLKGVMEKPAGVGTIKQPSESGRSPSPVAGNLAVDEEAGAWSQYDKYRRDPYNWNWPKQLGFAEEPVKTTLPVGTRLDRYGEPAGSFLAPKGTPYGERALAPGAKAEKYYEYEVVKPLPVMQGKIAPAFGETGGGVKILPNMEQRVNIEWLIDKGYLKEIK
ncbi:TNT domain-containing protein [Biostraticola tofi]|uniref:Uncharacterized protein DUF4237 n=1 Tax=Biostraticola tofi TaxID=466109 RepID=A0A4R3YJR4_9GAMM|nr:TNT domain-containing protein [Biostraticola tofi]TCV90963.1 uncharacterized protein DUF4237 [Biostraticola tofi]